MRGHINRSGISAGILFCHDPAVLPCPYHLPPGDREILKDYRRIPLGLSGDPLNTSCLSLLSGARLLLLFFSSPFSDDK